VSLVKFKTSSEAKMAKVDSMTVFNTEEVETTKQPMFFGKPLGIQRYDNYKYPVFERRSPCKKIEVIIRHFVQNRNIYSPVT
jgi:hypothetical protein